MDKPLLAVARPTANPQRTTSPPRPRPRRPTTSFQALLDAAIEADDKKRPPTNERSAKET